MFFTPVEDKPVMAVNPGKNGTVSFLPKDLKFSIWTSLRYSFHPFLLSNDIIRYYIIYTCIPNFLERISVYKILEILV